MSLPIYQAPQEQALPVRHFAILAHILLLFTQRVSCSLSCSTFTLFHQLMLIADDRFTNVSFRPGFLFLYVCVCGCVSVWERRCVLE